MTDSSENPLPRYWAIIPAAGIGSRMQTDRPKQYLSMSGKTVLEYTLDCFIDNPQITATYIAIANDDQY